MMRPEAKIKAVCRYPQSVVFRRSIPPTKQGFILYLGQRENFL